MKKFNLILLLYALIFSTIIQASTLSKIYANELQTILLAKTQQSYSPQEQASCHKQSTISQDDRTTDPKILIENSSIELIAIKKDLEGQSKKCFDLEQNLDIALKECFDLEQNLDIALKEREYYRLIASRLAITSFFLANALLANR